MEWWLKALLTIGGVSAGVTANYYYNDYYRQRGVEHPITAFIRARLSDEAVDRQKRIADIHQQSLLAESRLAHMHRRIPAFLREADASAGSITGRQPVGNEAWKSDFS